MSVFDPLKHDAARFAGTTKDLGANAAKAFEALGGAGQGAGSGLASAALWPVRAVVKVARWPVAMASGLYKSFPKLSAVATIAAGVGLAASFFRNRAEKRTQQEIQEGVLAAQPTYMNSVSPDEASLLAARQQESASAGHAASVAAARAQVPSPEKAAAL